MASKVANYFIDLDIYGHPISVLYQGKSTYKTRMGAFLTLLTFAAIIFNIVNLSIGFLDGRRQEES